MNSDGKTQRITGQYQDNQRADDSGGVEQFRENSQVYGLGSLQTPEENSEWRDYIRELFPDGHANLGKFLERLHLIEKTHIAYVKAHQGRLKARLEESTAGEIQFLQEVRSLEADILQLIENEPRPGEAQITEQ